ncbi:phage minor head protein [Bacillus solitudinis]|uniref:phage minor head protein n=1 Tax=Bacillus solitudinis TaxID=2014074 RepID=UPI0012FD7A93|nr:phage minor head protein [Bacillus solitudinis]
MSLQKKFEKQDKALNRQEKGLEKRLIQNYQASLKEVRSKLAKLYETTNGNYTDAVKFNRLAKLEKEIAKEIGKLTGKNARTLQNGLGSMYAESYYRTAYIVEGEAAAKLGFGLLNQKVIERAVENPLDRVGFLKRNRDNQARLTRQLQEQLAQGLIQGKSYQETARNIKQRMDVGASNVMRIVQTESHRVQQGGRLDSLLKAESAGVVMKKVWVATLDGDTRDTHQELDGQSVGLGEMFEVDGESAEYPGGFGDPAQDINCRCSTRAEIEGYEPSVRRSEDGVVEQQTYEQWKENRIGA